MPSSTPSSESPNQTGPGSKFRLSLDKVERLNSWRAQYILVYIVWLGIQLYLYSSYLKSGGEMSLAYMMSANVLLLFFFYRFASVLRMMGYPFWAYIPACVLAALPIPGVLIVAYMDRSIGKTLRHGLDVREKYLREHDIDPDTARTGGT